MKKLHHIKTITILILIIYSLSTITAWGSNNNSYSILVDLNESKLYLLKIDTNEIIKTYPIAGGKRSTPSPIGTWVVINKGEWDKGFGTRWIGLNVPWGQYGIHGTNKPLTIGGPHSLGCIRMLNKDAEELYRYTNHGTIVVIYGGPYGLYHNEFRTLLPGNTGNDVLEVERSLKNENYYNGNLDGIYGEALKKAVIDFRKAHNLANSHYIDGEFYKALGIEPFE